MTKRKLDLQCLITDTFSLLVKEGYYVGSDVTVSLEFRATALDGVLVGVSSARVDAIGLELINGQVRNILKAPTSIYTLKFHLIVFYK